MHLSSVSPPVWWMHLSYDIERWDWDCQHATNGQTLWLWSGSMLCGDDGDTSSMLNYHRKVHLFIHFALFTIFISRGKLRIFFSKTVYVMFVCRALTDSKYCQLFNRVKTSENISSNRKSVNCNIYNIRYIYSKTKMTLYITSLISQMK